VVAGRNEDVDVITENDVAAAKPVATDGALEADEPFD
jgi:hypothetical protein